MILGSRGSASGDHHRHGGCAANSNKHSGCGDLGDRIRGILFRGDVLRTTPGTGGFRRHSTGDNLCGRDRKLVVDRGRRGRDGHPCPGLAKRAERPLQRPKPLIPDSESIFCSSVSFPRHALCPFPLRTSLISRLVSL